jgi:hypothetical protein
MHGSKNILSEKRQTIKYSNNAKVRNDRFVKIATVLR